MHVVKRVMYFVLMDLLQVVQYSFLATDVDPRNPTFAQMESSEACRSPINRWLTVAGMIHIAYQPLFSSMLASAFVRHPSNVSQWRLVQRLQILEGTFLAARHFATYLDASMLQSWGIDARYTYGGPRTWDAETSVEWLSGPILCTYQGLYHLAWSVPFVPISYYATSMALHLFLMFAPFLLVDHGSLSKNFGLRVAGVGLFLIGPAMADWWTPNKHEAASIWCFFSIIQVVGMVCLVVIPKMMLGKWFAEEPKKRRN